MPAADEYPSNRPVTSHQRSPPRLRNPLDYFKQRFQRTQSNAGILDITVPSPSEMTLSLSEHTQQARPELLSPESTRRSLPPTHEEYTQTSGSHLGDPHDTYRSTTPSQPPCPVGLMPVAPPPSSKERGSQHSRSRSRGPDEHYQMSLIPEGIMYPNMPLRSHGHRC
ncbi:hypothetical protein AZE42_08937 [Rhizopogon vesiculosus]|uniref:Uncharacterized protein n=1 Tax=Rhizopogon vesiculosus TaxID=180088 RepID=A0A1J8QHE6_9AGAM|nr:hypothetical protein AZE42_08937 [Rhizopogon vesiculosus]